MKKVLALVLAVMMMATVAFAATTEIAAGQKNFEIGRASCRERVSLR